MLSQRRSIPDWAPWRPLAFASEILRFAQNDTHHLFRDRALGGKMVRQSPNDLEESSIYREVIKNKGQFFKGE